MSIYIFWISFGVILYTYVGYLLVLFIIWSIKQKCIKKEDSGDETYEPTVTIFIAAYNEKEVIPAKITNLHQLDYPSSKLSFLWITDGSTDGSDELIRQYPRMELLHDPIRRGKVGAINRGMSYVNSEIVIFCDANSMFTKNTIREIVKYFQDPKVGCVAGEKNIIVPDEENASAVGEGSYWKIESKIKWLESEVGSTVGAPGEICAIRRELFYPLEPDTILDDFILSLRVVQKGYFIKYAPNALATETSSFSISDEMKRKIRIAAGCFQAIPRLKSLLNVFKYGFFSIQFFSHKILRWLIVPPALFLILIINFFIYNQEFIYKIFLYLQLIFYSIALVGYIIRDKKVRYKFIFLPFYFIMMNYAQMIGLYRFITKKQTVNWEKARRKELKN